MSTFPRLESRVSSVEHRQTVLEARVEEKFEDMISSIKHLSYDLDASFGKLSKYHIQTEEQLAAQFKQIDAQFKIVDARFNRVDERLDKMDARLDKMDARFVQIDEQFKQVNTRLDKLETRFDKMETLLTQILIRLPENPTV